MFRLTIVFWSAVMPLLITGCSDSCESVQDEMKTIGGEIQKDPGQALERSNELEALRDKLQKMGCLG
jgi:hypothetical protein